MRDPTPLDVVTGAFAAARACLASWATGRPLDVADLRAAFGRLRAVTDKVHEMRVPSHPVNMAYMLRQGADGWQLRRQLEDLRTRTIADGTSAANALALLPPQWDTVRDPVVLMGDVTPGLVRGLLASGQRRIVVVAHVDLQEPPQVLDAATPLDVRVAVTSFPGEAATRATVKVIGDHVPAATFAAAVGAAQDGLDVARCYNNTVQLFGEVWVRNGLRNLASLALHPPIGVLREAFVGRPIVLVAPGPSLEKQLPHLAAIQGRAIILACSHAVRALAAHGIVADFAMALDPEDLRYHFDSVPLDRTTVILGATVHPGCYDISARILHFAANPTIEGWLYAGLEEDAGVRTGGSVATTTLALALDWRCDPIVLVGHDLAYTGGQVYASSGCDGGARITETGATFQIAGYDAGYAALESMGGATITPPTQLIEVPGYYEGTVKSCYSFDAFRRWMGRTAGEATATGARIWNATEGGARIENMQHVEFAAFASGRYESLEAIDVAGIVRGLCDAVPRRRRIAAQRRYIANVLVGVRRIRELAIKARVLSLRAEKDGRHANALARVGQKLEREVGRQRFVQLANQAFVKKLDRKLFDGMTLRHALVQARESYDRLVDVCDLCAGDLRGGEKLLEAS